MNEYVYLGKVKRRVDEFGLSVAGGVIHNGDLYLKYPKIFEHMFIQGATGSGKTTFLLGLIDQFIADGIKVVIVDGAGNLEFAERICVLAQEHNAGTVPVVKFGQESRPLSAVFNGFVGSNQAVYSRLVALLALQDTGTDADYYKGIKRNILSLVCGVNTHIEYVGTDFIEPPRSFQELQERLTDKWFRNQFGKSALAIGVYEENIEHVKEFRSQAAERIRPFLHMLDLRGFKLGDHNVAVFSIDAAKGGQPAEYLFQFLGEAFKDAMGTTGRMVWIIDEVGVFGGKVASQFTKIGRQKGLGIVMALQSVASLREEQYIEEILDTTNTKVIMRNEVADELRARAGTRKEKDKRRQQDKDGMTIGASVGFRDGDRIRHEDVKNLPDGGAFVMIGGAIIQIQTTPVQMPFLFDQTMEDRRYREDRLLKPPSDTPPKNRPDDDPFKEK